MRYRVARTERRKMHTGVWWRHLKGRYHSEDHGVGDRTILKWILNSAGGRETGYGNELYISVSVHHKSIIYNKPTRCNSGSIVFINNYKCALHVSDALCVHLHEHYKL